MENKPGKSVNKKGINKKLNNLIYFDDFDKTLKPKKQKPTKKTNVGLDIVNEQHYTELDENEKREMLKRWLNNMREPFLDKIYNIIMNDIIESGDDPMFD